MAVTEGGAGRSRGPAAEPEGGVELFQSVDWSCCCCSRRTGILILGASFLALSLGALALCAAEAALLQAELHPAAPPVEDKRGATAMPPPPTRPPPPTQPPQLQPHPQAPIPSNETLRAQARRVAEGVQGLLVAQSPPQRRPRQPHVPEHRPLSPRWALSSEALHKRTRDTPVCFYRCTKFCGQKYRRGKYS